jgi:hypothetical protein
MDEKEWLACTEPRRMLEFLWGKASERKVRLFVVAACRRIEHLLPHKSLRNALEVSEQFADGLVSRALLDEAQRAAYGDSGLASGAVVAACMPTDPLCPECGAAMKPRQGPRGLFHGCSTYPRCRGVRASLQSGGDNAARTAAGATGSQHPEEWERTYTSELYEQSQLMRDIFGNPFRPVALSPAWQTPTVLALATAAYDHRELPSGHLDPDRLAVLADALEDVGADAEILGHLRGDGTHWRGCWCVDSLLGRS